MPPKEKKEKERKNKKINSKYIKGLNARAKILRLLEINIGVNLSDNAISNGFLDLTKSTSHQVKTRQVSSKRLVPIIYTEHF
jgi:hypothetical protein